MTHIPEFLAEKQQPFHHPINRKNDFRIGDRVETWKFGMATIVAFENISYNTLRMSSICDATTNRLVVCLDDPSLWRRDTHPHISRSDIIRCSPEV